jgi:cellulose synthase/poly-beta-1,6-N-acetylglucosamine synthase-like glycosyltransferase
VIPALLLGVALIVAAPGVLASVHLTVLALASLAYRAPQPSGRTHPRTFLVLVPAHNEEALIGRTLDQINAVKRDRDMVLVVADRCTDDTAAIARKAGAMVLERQPGEEPGRAAARQAGQAYALRHAWDAIVMIDADSVVEEGFFDACERAMAGGAEALQARSEAALGDNLVARAYVAAFAMQGVLIPRGRDRLGLLVRMRGTGMVLSRRVVEHYEFRGAAGEDRWFGLDLCLDGVRPRHVDGARLRSENVGSWRAASTQRLRYEAGRMSAAREFVGPLLLRRTAAAFEAAVDLLTPPFAMAMLCLAAGGALAALAGQTVVAVVLLALLGCLGLDLMLALVQAGAGARTWIALLAAPWYILWKVGVQLRALGSVLRRDTEYAPTARD